MGFLRRAFRADQQPQPWPPPGPITSWPDQLPASPNVAAYLFTPAGRARVDVVGESAHQGTLEQIGGGRTIDGMRDPDHTAVLVPQPTNPYDPNAVRVVIVSTKPGQTGGTVGYLSRENAVAYRSVIDRVASVGRLVACLASLEGGWDRGPDDQGNIGVSLFLGTVAECETEMAEQPPTAD